MMPLENFSKYVLDRLNELQYGGGQRLLLLSQMPIGLGGQIYNRLLGLSLALRLNRKVVFPFAEDPPYTQVYQPLHSPIAYADALRESTDFFAPEANEADIIRLQSMHIWENSQLRQQTFSYLPEGMPECEEPTHYFLGTLLSFLRPTSDIETMLAAANKRLKIDDGTLGVHIRRGDKTAETPYVPIDVFNEHIADMCAKAGFRRVFACSDSADVFAKLKLPPGSELVFDDQEVRYNNANHRFLKRRPEFAKQETYTAVKIIYLLGKCGALVGQSNTHFPALSAGLICHRNGGRRIYDMIDGNYMIEHSVAVRIFYAVKQNLRAMARALLPWLTMRHADRKQVRR